MIEVAKNILKDYKNVELYVSSAETIPFGDNTFDIVTCNLFFMKSLKSSFDLL